MLKLFWPRHNFNQSSLSIVVVLLVFQISQSRLDILVVCLQCLLVFVFCCFSRAAKVFVYEPFIWNIESDSAELFVSNVV